MWGMFHFLDTEESDEGIASTRTPRHLRKFVASRMLNISRELGPWIYDIVCRTEKVPQLLIDSVMAYNLV